MAESHRTPAAGAAPPRKVFVLEELPSQPQGAAPSPGGTRLEPERKIRDREPQVWDREPQIRAQNPQIWAPRWWVGAMVALLALSCLAWALLHGLAAKKQQELREELELLREDNTESWAQAWQLLLQVQLQQQELSRITELMCQTIEDSKKCPSGWEFYEHSCYFFSILPRSWGDARGFCSQFSADLVVVSTEEEQLFLMKKIQGNNTYWMGVTDEQHEGKWTWVTGKSPTFGFWDVWEEDPDKELKDCGLMKPNGRWTNERCSKASRWICEKSWDCNFSPLFPISKQSAPDY